MLIVFVLLSAQAKVVFEIKMDSQKVGIMDTSLTLVLVRLRQLVSLKMFCNISVGISLRLVSVVSRRISSGSDSLSLLASCLGW